MSQHDWEALHAQLSTATGVWSREELVGLLGDLIREYVVERGLPTGTPAAAATPDLTGMDFAQLITWLKRTLSLAELDLFQVDGRRVIIDADGPRVISGQNPAPAPSAAPAQPASAPAPASGARQAARPVGQPAAPAPEAAAEDDESAPSKRKLSRGFRGLEFD